MTIKIRDEHTMRLLREGRNEQGSVFTAGRGLAILDPDEARQANQTNYSDTILPDRLVDLLRGKTSAPVDWKDIRGLFISQVKALSEPGHVAALDRSLTELIEERVGRELDLTRAIQEIFSRALIPLVAADLTPREFTALERDQSYKLERLMRKVPRKETRSEFARSALLQFRSGRAVRRVLRDRASGKRPRQTDLADPIVDLIADLGMDRAAHAVTTVLTAVAGPPGAVAVCMLLELVQRPDWAARLEDELGAVPDHCFHQAATRSAPITNRFVKESLRVWSSPLVMTRSARAPITVRDRKLEVGDEFHISPYFAHHDPSDWPDPDSFDPDRWLSESGRGPARPCAYAPFGWAPSTCIGAGLGTIELMLLCRLFSTRYRIDLASTKAIEMVMAAVPLPVGFRGTISRRSKT